MWIKTNRMEKSKAFGVKNDKKKIIKKYSRHKRQQNNQQYNQQG